MAQRAEKLMDWLRGEPGTLLKNLVIMFMGWQ